MGKIRITAIIVFFTAVGAFAHGAALMLMWNWFIAEQMSLPLLGIFDAAGIAILIGYLVRQSTKQSHWMRKGEGDGFTEWVLQATIGDVIERAVLELQYPVQLCVIGWLLSLPT